MYINSFAKLGVGRCRYGLMLNEAGFVMDDGVIARLAEDRFHVTTTTVGAAHVIAQMEDYRQTEWPDLKVWFTSTTEQWATIAINGPHAREMLEPLVEDIDISAAALPHLSMREGHICGVPTRLARVSFTGELGFEVNVPTDYGRAIWEAIWAEGAKFDCVAYGLDVLLILRAEKGFIVVGQETDGTVTPDDLGLGKMIAQSKPDFVGKRSLALADLKREGRKQLVGLLPDDPLFKLDEGAQVVDQANPRIGAPALGHVTSSYFSPALGRTFAMALVAGGRAKIGGTAHVTTMDGTALARVVEPVFYDKEGKRLDG
jgi:sarcosine oxidase subunit alpha